MPELLLFVEDQAQERFLTALLLRIAAERKTRIAIRPRATHGGFAKVLSQLADFAEAVERNREPRPDGVVVGLDANCQGHLKRRGMIIERAGQLSDLVICAIPDPHIERWFLLDGEAFRKAVGFGCDAPDEKCEKGRYKRLLNQAVRKAGVQPLLGGVEYAEDIVNACNIQKVADREPSFGRLVSDFRAWLNRQQRGV
jgi:hypothetical protein